MSDYSWFKFYTTTPKDDKLKGKPASAKWLWCCLMNLARESEEPGIIPLFKSSPYWLASYAEIKVKEAEVALAHFEDPEIGMVTILEDGRLALPHFEKRQASSDPTAAQRMKRLRERSPNVTPPVTRTLRVDTDTETDTETETEEESANADIGRANFLRFRAIFPKNRGAWPIAERRFLKLSLKDQAAAIVGAGHYAKSRSVADGKVKYVEAWISERRWESWQEPEEPAPTPLRPDSQAKYHYTEEQLREIRGLPA